MFEKYTDQVSCCLYDKDGCNQFDLFLSTGNAHITATVEPVLKDHPSGHTKVASLDTWSLVTGSVALKCRTFSQEYQVF